MKLTLFFLLITIATISAQTSESTVRIVGNSIVERESIGMKIDLTLTSIERSEYQKIREKSIKEINDELQIAIKRLGYKKSDLVEVFPPARSYGKKSVLKYQLKTKGLDDTKLIFGIDIKGLAVSNPKFIYSSFLNVSEEEMTADALKDARIKGEKLAKKANKKLGRILHIDDTTKGNNSFSSNSDKQKMKYKYRLTVTFELLDI